MNYGPEWAQCYTQLPFERQEEKEILRDLLGETRYERNGGDLTTRGLYLELPPWGYHVFSVEEGE